MAGAGELEIRKAIIAACREMSRLGINQGTSGNISVRDGDGLLVTPTSLPYDAMEPEDIVRLTLDGEPTGRRRPSSEWRFHCAILRERGDVNAVVHAHPIFCTALAILERPIPPVHYMIAAAGGADIRCAPYAIFGSEELSRNAVEALRDRRACLLSHHGLIAVGSRLDKAMWLAVEVETLARQYHAALQIGDPPLLSERQIAEAAAKMADYGHAG